MLANRVNTPSLRKGISLLRTALVPPALGALLGGPATAEEQPLDPALPAP